MAKDKSYGSAVLTREEPTRKAAIIAPPAPKATPTRTTSTPVADVDRSAALPFGRKNYQLMLVGIGLILAGFFVMSLDKEEFGFGFLGLTLGPLIVLSGFILEFFAILARPSKS